MPNKPELTKECAINLDNYPDEGIFEILLDPNAENSCSMIRRSLLLIVHLGKYHVIENKCGHFGVPLSNGELRDNEIICAEHGISFDLDTGAVVNRPYENCDPIKILAVKMIDRVLYFQDP